MRTPKIWYLWLRIRPVVKSNVPTGTPIATFKTMKARKKLKKPKKRSVKLLKLELWKYLSLYVKQRDNWTCYTCKKYVHGSNAHCGHFVPSSICGLGLRYDPDNLRTQCFACNVFKSGNYVTFRENLVKDYGEEYVKRLEARRHEITKDFDYEAAIEKYKRLVS